jgi:Mn-dependent DtxR family transcriptional regulator
MKRGLMAPLSPNEEQALRRVAHGISKPKHLRAQSIERLKRLALVEEREDGRIRLTELGIQRCTDGKPVLPGDSTATPAA